jgi:hypothetical protein
VSHPKGDWTATDPCLLTREIVELADWLEAIQHGERVPKVLEFIEPNLWFQLRTANKIKGKALRVYSAFELRPPRGWRLKLHGSCRLEAAPVAE